MSGQHGINRYNDRSSCLESLFGRIDQYVQILIWKKFGRIDQYVRILIMNQKWWYYSFWMFTKLLGTRLKRLKNCYQIILSTQCECVDSGSDTSVNTVFSLRNWRGNTHLRAFGPSVHIAPPISQTSDRIHWCVLPRVNAFSQCGNRGNPSVAMEIEKSQCGTGNFLSWRMTTKNQKSLIRPLRGSGQKKQHF